jgi:hypothetical protein
MRISILVAGLLISGLMNAQNYTRDAGLRVGDYFTLSYRQFIEEDMAVEGLLFFGRNGVTVTVLKEMFQPALGHISDNLYFQYGFGAHIGYRYTDRYKVLNRTYQLTDYRFSPLLGIDGMAGFEYRFPDFPVIVGVDIRPYFEYTTIQIFSLYLQSIGISIKYRF